MSAAPELADAPGVAHDAPSPASREPTYPVGLFEQFKSKLGWYLVGSILLFAQQTMLATRDFLVRDGVDAATGHQFDAAQAAALSILGVSVAAAIARVLSRVTIFSAGRNVEYELRAMLLARLYKLGPSFFRRMPTGEVMSRATNDITQVRLLLGFGILNVMSSLFALVSALYVMASTNLRLTAASLAMLPALLLVTRAFSTRIYGRTKDAQEAIGSLSDRVLASLAGIRVVRSFALVGAEKTAFEERNQNHLEKGLALARLRGSIGPVMGAVSSIGVLIAFWYGGSLLAEGEISQGEFVAFWLALLRLTWPLSAIGFVAAIVQRGRAGYARLAEILKAEPDITDGPLEAQKRSQGGLDIRGLSFSHGETRVLEDVEFRVDAGRSIAIVGRTGAGKSTLASLLARLLPTPPSTVFLDGQDICDLPLKHVRETVGYAQQDAFLFSTTVSDNVGYALADRDSEEAIAAIRAAASEASVLHELEGLPEGMNTVVGERGVQLSGGQRQRVSLARALLRHSPILVLDDPMSAVDAKTEAAILDAIDRQKAARTLVLITHRVEAAKRCDSVVVLERGRIVERGSHDELVARGGLYAAFAEEQALESGLDEPLDSNPSLDEEPADGR